MSWKASGAAKEITHGTSGQKLKMADKLVLMVLSDDYNEGRGFAWPSQETLAKECLCTDRGLRGILERLEAFGLINIEHRGRLGNRYKLLFALKTSKTLRNGVPQSVGDIEEQEENIEERNGNIEERAGSSELEVKPLEEPLVVLPSKPSQKSKPSFNFKNFSRRYYKLVGTTPSEKPWDKEAYTKLCEEWGEDAVLGKLKDWVNNHGGPRKLKENIYAPGDFLKQVVVMLEEEPEDKEASYPHGTEDNFNWDEFNKLKHKGEG